MVMLEQILLCRNKFLPQQVDMEHFDHEAEKKSYEVAIFS